MNNDEEEIEDEQELVFNIKLKMSEKEMRNIITDEYLSKVLKKELDGKGLLRFMRVLIRREIKLMFKKYTNEKIEISEVGK